MSDFNNFQEDFLNELRSDSAHAGTYTEDEFIDRILEILENADEISDPVRVDMGDKKGKGGRLMRMDGYGFDDTDQSLLLFISDFEDTLTPSKLTNTRVDQLYGRLYFLLDEICNGQIYDYFDDSDEILQISDFIRKRMDPELIDDPQGILKIKFYILTNKTPDSRLLVSELFTGETKSEKRRSQTKKGKALKKIRSNEFLNKPLEINIWYPERYYELVNEYVNEPIVIDIDEDYPELGYTGIPCIKGEVGNNLGYAAYIAIIPGKLLASIYIDHGSRVLEGNVRAFLGTRGKNSVNYGIKYTINNSPTKFFTYNNGIACTASSIKTKLEKGTLWITQITDFQIINGGQTTASLAEAVLKKTNEALEGIYVPMKLTVIEERDIETEEGIPFYEDMVSKIARYANNQNKVTSADFFSNDPFHVEMEKMSKKILAQHGNGLPNGWYYERSRKKYQQEQFKLKGRQLKDFQSKFPKNQVITKEQLAMYMTAMEQRPDIVAKGKDWTMKRFGASVNEKFRKSKDDFNELYFKRCVCAAIIYRSVDNYLEKNKSTAKKPTNFWYKTGGYKLDIVPYTVSKIVSAIPKGFTLDYADIWKNQAISPAFIHEVEIVTKITNDFICDSHGVIVTEYCKKEETWNRFKSLPYTPAKEFLNELMPEDMDKEDVIDARKDTKTNSDFNEVLIVIKAGELYWNELLQKGMNAKLLSYADQRVLKDVASIARKAVMPGGSKVPAKIMKAIHSAYDIKYKMEANGIDVTMPEN